MTVASLHRTLDQALVALLRGASLECLVCGEFVMHAHENNVSLNSCVFCPECGSQLGDEQAFAAGLESTMQAG